MRAFVLVKTEDPEGVKRFLDGLPEVREAHLVYGGYDVVAVVEVPDIKRLGSIVLEELREHFPIKETLTLITLD